MCMSAHTSMCLSVKGLSIGHTDEFGCMCVKYQMWMRAHAADMTR